MTTHSADCGVHFGSVSCTCGALFVPVDDGYEQEEFFWQERAKAAEARAVAAEAERDKLSAIGQKDADKLLEFLHRAKKAEAELETLREALADIESHVEQYPGVGVAEWVRQRARVAFDAPAAQRSRREA